MAKVNYVLVNKNILPEVYSKVINAKKLLATGEASSASQAAKMAGISRSAYYKYKDQIFEYAHSGDDVLTIKAKLIDNAGVLSSVMNELYEQGMNILSVNQNNPVDSVADVSITVRAHKDINSVDDLIENIKIISGVKSAEIV